MKLPNLTRRRHSRLPEKAIAASRSPVIGKGARSLDNDVITESNSDFVASNLDDIDADCYGRIEAFNGVALSGWYFDGKNQQQRLRVLLDGKMLQSTDADMERLDVQSAQPAAPLHCGFYFDVKDQAILDQIGPIDDIERRLQVLNDDGRQLKHCYNKIIFSEARTSTLSNIHGAFDGIEETSLKGWAIGLDGSSAAVNLVIDGLHQGIGDTDISREDVGQATGHFRAGFLYPIPKRFLDGRRHFVRCTYVHNGLDLPGSPKHLVLPLKGEGAAKRSDALLSILFQIQSQLETLGSKIKSELIHQTAYLQNYPLLQEVFRMSKLSEAVFIKKRHECSSEIFTIVMPTFKSDLSLLRRAIDSVIAQTDQCWELIISDSSSSKSVRTFLKDCADIEPRIKVILHKGPMGISDNTSSALRIAKGNYIGFLDHDDELAPEAVSICRLAFETGLYDIVYTDEDKIDVNGNFVSPHFKPAFNIDLLLCMNYLCHLVFIKREVLFATKLLRSEFDGAQDWDLLLQAIKIVGPARVGHVPRVLYHWRMVAGSTAAAITEKNYAVQAGLDAVRDYLVTSKLDAEATLLRDLPYVDVRWNKTAGTKVSIIIPTKDRIDLLTNCINSVLATVGSVDLEILVVDNNSSAYSRKAFTELCTDRRIQILQYGEKFNYSAINNFAAKHASGSMLLLLNNDVFFTRQDWLEQMSGIASRSDVGAVGLKLLYPDNTVQHCGVVIGNGGVAGHAFSNLSVEDSGYFARAACTQEVSAVTAACLLIRTDLFWKVGGLDERDLQVAFNDVDLCLKVQQAGFRNILVASTFAYHAESVSRGYEDSIDKIARFNGEINAMKERWGSKLQADRFYNPNFDLGHACYTVLDLPHVARQEIEMVEKSIAR